MVIKCFACAFGPLDSPAAGWNFRHLKKLMDVAGSEANKDPLDSWLAVAQVFYNVDWVMLFPYA